MTDEVLKFDPNKKLHDHKVNPLRIKSGESILIGKVIATKQRGGKFVVTGDAKEVKRLQEQNKKLNQKIKTSTCKVCGTQLHKYNRVRIRKENGSLSYPNVCKQDLPYLTDSVERMVSGDLSTQSRIGLMIGPQGSPSGRAYDEIANEVNEQGVSKAVQNIVHISRDYAKYLARYAEHGHSDVDITFGKSHRGPSTNDCFTCLRMKEHDPSINQVTLSITHDSNLMTE